MGITNQKADVAPIGFRLEPLSGAAVSMTLPIRPEELTYNQPALQTTVQTLDGAFIDDFGAGIQTVQISGHTGWGSGSRPNGIAQFQALHEAVWVRWQKERQTALQQGQDPSLVRLIFIDALNARTYLVAPSLFQLKRNRTRPLLAMYQINMTVLDDSVAPAQGDPLAIGAGNSPLGVLAGLASLKHSISQLQTAAGKLRTFVDATIVQPMHAFMGVTDSVMSGVVGLVDGVKGVVGAEAAQLAGVGADLAMAGRNAFQAYNAVANLPDFLKVEVGAVAANYQNAFCVLKNSFRKVDEYPDYSGLFGAFNCSSTIGGAPLSAYADLNPWAIIAPRVPSVAAITPDSRVEMDLLKRIDPVLGGMSASELGTRLANAARGIAVTL